MCPDSFSVSESLENLRQWLGEGLGRLVENRPESVRTNADGRPPAPWAITDCVRPRVGAKERAVVSVGRLGVIRNWQKFRDQCDRK
jgi:hypothetical protein